MLDWPPIGDFAPLVDLIVNLRCNIGLSIARSRECIWDHVALLDCFLISLGIAWREAGFHRVGTIVKDKSGGWQPWCQP